MDYSRQDAFLSQQFNKKIDSNNFSSFKLLIIGAGGTGSLFSQLALRGGFTTLTILDSDFIDKSNLQRQNYTHKQLNSPKVEALKENLLAINPTAHITSFGDMFTKKNASDLIKTHDLCIDCSDNFKTRELIETLSKHHKKDWIYTGAVKAEVSTCVFLHNTNHFTFLFPKKVQDISCCEVGVLASTVHIGASLAYNELLRYILEEKFTPKFIKYHIFNQQLTAIDLK